MPPQVSRKDTIAALATPPGQGGIAIIRLSGAESLQFASHLFCKNFELMDSHRAYYGKLQNSSGELLDTVLALPMKAPHSFTGEDVVEFHCHGSPLIVENVLQSLFKLGVRPATPGEFSMRAFLNGKMDLSQAEAIQELIGAQNQYALKAAQNHMQGALSKKIHSIQKQLIHLTAVIEAWVDFPEEDLEFLSNQECIEQMSALIFEIQKLLSTYHEGRRIQEGIRICLLGVPNAGKSSLMNSLLDHQRAIVTHIAGTTRDVLEDSMRLGGVHVRLTDTAGIRETDELVESEGIKRSWQASGESDIILLVLDSNRGLDDEQRDLLNKLPPEKTIAIWNKVDLASPPNTQLPFTSYEVSALSGVGVDALKETILHHVWQNGSPSQEEVLVTTLRHQQQLTKAHDALERAKQTLEQKDSPEFIALDLRVALEELGAITGTDITERLLDSIFSQFCLGK